MVTIAGYEVTAKLYESSRSLVYRGQRSSASDLATRRVAPETDLETGVILKLMQAATPTPEELSRYRQEYEILRRLKIEGVAKAYGLEPYQNRLVLILEDGGGESLRQILRSRALSLTEVLQIAISLTEILSRVHAANVIHKDINPANVLLNPTTGEVRLIDFGHATVLSRENPTLRNPDLLEGTLAYLSPEQTGRMNRSLDYRTDFYSLGATLYELLTGAPPFAATDPIELIHCHLAKPPEPPEAIKPDIPSAVSQIILKLLAKNAEDRYQSAHGIRVDLQRCLEQLQQTGTIAPFPLAQQDASGRFQIPQKLYGREKEVAVLLAAFSRVAAGAGTTQSKTQPHELVLVRGSAGIGKSALVREIYKPITQRKGYFASGKFDQLQRNVPYSALIQAFQELIRQLLTESAAQIEQWRTNLLVALGRNGQIVIDVIPEVELILGPQPLVLDLAPKEAQNRFNLVFQKFVQVFAQSHHPLVIFLDDLQWADAASLKFIELLLSRGERQHLFLVGAYRSNEVDALHPLQMMLTALRKAGVTINQIDLPPLTAETVQQIIAETCHCSPLEALPLADYVMQMTNGNPFFLSEFLKSLYTEGLLNFNGQTGRWQWQLSQIEATHLPDDVVELMAGKIQRLPLETQQILKLAACIGNRFDTTTLSIVAQTPPAMLAPHLWQSVQSGLLVSLTGSSLAGLATSQPLDRVLSFKFLHDRIQQAAYSLIPDAEKQQIHYQIGQSLLMHLSAAEQEDRIFDIVNPLNLGMRFLPAQPQRDELARLNLLAGKKAKESTAYDAALRYLLTGIDLVTEPGWQTQYALTLALHEAAAEAAYLNADFEEADRLVERILHYAQTVLDRVKAYQVRIQAYSAQYNLEAALDAFVTVMKRLGEPIPRHPTRLQVGLELLRTRYWMLGNRPVEQLETLPPMTDPYKLAVMQLVGAIAMPANNVEPLFTAVLALRVLNLVIKYGSSPQSVLQGIAYGVMLRVGLGEIDRAYEFGQLTLRLLDRLEARQYRTLSIVGFEACLRHWKDPLRQSLSPLLAAYAEGLELGNQEAASLAASVYCFHRLFLGEPLAAVAELFQQYEARLLEFRQEPTVYSMLPWHQLVLHLQTPPEENPAAGEFAGTVFNEAELLPRFVENRLGIPLFYAHIAKLIWLYHCGDYAGAIRAAEQAEPLQESSPGTLLYANLFFYWSLACLAHYPNVSRTTQRRYLSRVARHQRRAKRWARYCPINYQHRYYLVEAERLRVLNRYAAALDAYDRAIAAVKTQDFRPEVGLANELAGKFFLSLGKENLAQVYLRQARTLYEHWGATFKVHRLDQAYPQAFEQPADLLFDLVTPTVAVTHPQTRQSTGSTQGLNLDLDTVIKAAQAISGEIVLNQLLEKLLQLVMENAGAQKGCLLLVHQGELRIEAEAQLDDAALRVKSALVSEPQTAAVPPESRLAMSVINYVQRTRENVVLRDAVQEGLFTADPYILEVQARSILCSPILNQGNLMGIVYLENNLATDAFPPERVTVLNILSAQAAIALENALFYRTLEQKVEERTAQLAQANQEITLLNQRLQSENLRMSTELAITRQIQQMILPKELELEQIQPLEIAGYMEPAEEVGGDYYDVLYQDGKVKIGIGDITGHGLESGVLMLMVQTAVRTLLATQETNSAQFLSLLNRVIYDNVQRMNTNRNLTLVLLDYEAGRLRLSGQHEEVLVVRASGQIEAIDTLNLGFPIGLIEDISHLVAQTEVHLQPGDGVVLYTDGITEAANLSGQLYGLERLCQVVCQHWQQSAQSIRQAVIQDVRHHIGAQKVFDDITLLVIKQK